MRAARPAQTLKARALACIAQREHSRVELKRKLRAHAAKQARAAAEVGVPDGAPDAGVESEIEALLDWLAARDLLSDARFVETRVQARAARFGDLRIRRELAEHGVALDAGALAALRGSELARARAVKTKRFGASPPADPADRARQLRFLAARGFSAETARKVLRAAEE